MMTNLYIFLSHPIFGIGGAQTYVRDKRNYLKSIGWDVLIFSGCYSTRGLIVSEFAEYTDLVHPELIRKPITYTTNKRNKVAGSILAHFDPSKYNKIIIESSDVNSGEWGEIIASRCKALHVIFCLSEQFSKYSKSEYEFLRFKLSRNELFGIATNTMNLIFKDSGDYPHECFWSGACKFLPVEVPNQEIDSIERLDFNIGSIGRINKPYVPKMLENLHMFCKSHQDKSINLVLCMGMRDDIIEKSIYEQFSDLSNVRLHLIGQLYPLPKQLFRLCDVFISVAGCARYSQNENVPTITLDAYDHEPIGILGYTTNNSTYRNGEPVVNLCNLLNDILIEGICNNVIIANDTNDVDSEYQRQLNVVLSSENTCNYYNVPNMRLSGLNFFQLIIGMFGNNFYTRIKRILK